MIDPMDSITAILSDPWFLIIWGIQAGVALVILIQDLVRKNSHLMSLMKAVWIFTVCYSGLLGLAVYWYSGRRQISDDTIPRKSFRSVAHCYSGCGAGEIAGVLITVGLLSLGNWWVAGVTFTLAYVAGFALTMGPLMQEGVGFRQALKDAAISESASIAVMEIVAIGVDIWLAGDATMGDVLFWSALIVSLTAGLLAAYPVNVLLIKKGVKAGMHDPRQVHHHGHGEDHEQHGEDHRHGDDHGQDDPDQRRSGSRRVHHPSSRRPHPA